MILHCKINTHLIKPLTSISISFILSLNADLTSAATLYNYKNALPDLGQPTILAKAFNYDINQDGGGLVYKTAVLKSKFILTPEYYLNSGFNLGASASARLSNKLALGFVSNDKSNKNELLINVGIDLSDSHRLIYSLSQLRQKQNFSLISGATEKYMTQYSHAFRYKYLFSNLPDSNLKINGYLTNSQRQDFNNKNTFEDISDSTNFLYGIQNLAGVRMTGLRGQLSIHPSASSKLKLALSSERLEFKLPTNDYNFTRNVANVKWSQSLNSNIYLNAGFNLNDSQKRYKLGLVHLMPKRHQKIGLNIVSIYNFGNCPDDKLIQVNYSYKFGGHFSSPLNINSYNSIKKVRWANDLEDKVVARSSFIPTNVPTF